MRDRRIVVCGTCMVQDDRVCTPDSVQPAKTYENSNGERTSLGVGDDMLNG